MRLPTTRASLSSWVRDWSTRRCSSGPAAFRLLPPPPTLGAYLVLAFFALFLGLAHGALAALCGGARRGASSPPTAGRAASMRSSPSASGLFYATLGLSLFKFAVTRLPPAIRGSAGSSSGACASSATKAARRSGRFCSPPCCCRLVFAVLFFVALRVARAPTASRRRERRRWRRSLASRSPRFWCSAGATLTRASSPGLRLRRPAGWRATGVRARGLRASPDGAVASSSLHARSGAQRRIGAWSAPGRASAATTSSS